MERMERLSRQKGRDTLIIREKVQAPLDALKVEHCIKIRIEGISVRSLRREDNGKSFLQTMTHGVSWRKSLGLISTDEPDMPLIVLLWRHAEGRSVTDVRSAYSPRLLF